MATDPLEDARYYLAEGYRMAAGQMLSPGASPELSLKAASSLFEASVTAALVSIAGDLRTLSFTLQSMGDVDSSGHAGLVMIQRYVERSGAAQGGLS